MDAKYWEKTKAGIIMLIYMATNKINGLCYVGQTVQPFHRRQQAHVNLAGSDNNFFHNAINKYGNDAFDWQVLNDNVGDLDTLNALEKTWIIVLNAFDNGYNLTTGGNNYLISESTKTKISNSHIGKTHSDETKQKLSKSRRNRVFSEATKRKMSKSSSGKLNPMYGKFGEDNPFYGKTHSDETKQKMSEAKKGKPQPFTTCECGRQISLGNIRKHQASCEGYQQLNLV